MNNENWGCMKCGSTNDVENLFCEYCGNARPVNPVDIIKEKTKGFMEQVKNQILAKTNTRKCPVCETICNDDEIYCFSCGTKLDGDDSTPMQEIVPLEDKPTQKIACLNCGYMNLDTLRFCESCGEDIRKEKKVVAAQSQPHITGTSVCCPDCGARQLPNSLFCDECGAKLVYENGYSQ